MLRNLVSTLMDFIKANFGIPQRIHQAWCRYVIHRYLGHLLEMKLTLDQLSMKLGEGEINISDLKLNTEFINSTLETLDLPIRLIEGYIGSVSLKVPWSSVTIDSTEARVDQLQLTFQALERFNVDDTDGVSSMLGSVVDSLVSSAELAQEFCKNENLKNDDFNEDGMNSGTDGIKAFSQVIDAIISRFFVSFTDTIVRIERPPENGSAYCTGIEMEIKEMAFMDDQMKNVREGSGTTKTITSQPLNGCSIAKLNKYLSFKGLSFYTDVFSSVGENVELGEEASSSQCMTSMFIRRELQKQKDELTTSTQDRETLFQSTTSGMGDFQSCYSTLPTNQHVNFSSSNGLSSTTERLQSNPIKFAEFADNAAITIQIDNPSLTTKGPNDRKFSIDVKTGGVNVFLSPSQLVILQKFFTNISLEPKKKKSQNMGTHMSDETGEEVLQMHMMENQRCGGNLLGGDYGGGVDNFQAFSAIPLDDSIKIPENSSNHMNSPKTSKAGRTEGETTFVATIGYANIFVTHEDPLDKIHRDHGEQIERLMECSNQFFSKMSSFNTVNQKLTNVVIAKIRSDLDEAYPGNHLRCTAGQISIKMDNSNGRERIQVRALTFEIIESLNQESVKGATERTYVPLLTFKRETDEDRSESSIKVDIMRPSVGEEINLYLGRVVSELDISMLDRIASLIAPQPFFLEPKLGAFAQSRQKYPSRLSERLFGNEPEEKPSKTLVNLNCKEWTIDLKFPVVNLCNNRNDFHIRNLHSEILRVKLTGVRASLPFEGPHEIRFELLADSLVGWFIGDEDVLKCRSEDFCFLYGEKKFDTDSQFVKFSVIYDRRNKCLKDANLSTEQRHPDMEKSFSAAVIGSVPKREGLFAQIHQAYTRDETKWTEGLDEIDTEMQSENSAAMCSIVRAGSRAEMQQWSTQCEAQSNVKMSIHIPVLRLHIPNHAFLERLYNRLVNDLPLWVPSSPRLSKSDSNQLTETFRQCKNDVEVHDSDTSSETEHDEPSHFTNEEPIDRSKNHLFSLSFKSNKASFVVGTEVIENNQPVDEAQAQVCAEMEGPLLYVLYGFHANPLQTFFYFTSQSLQVAHDQRNKAPNNVCETNFGRYQAFRHDIVVERVFDEDLVELGEEDCLSVAMELNLRANQDDVKDTTLAISARQLLINARPFRDAGHLWVTQLAALFTLNDFDIEGYEVPKVQTEFHVNLDQIVLAYDHGDAMPGSDLKLRVSLSQADICCGSLEADCACELLCVFERTRAFLNNRPTKKTARFDDDVPRRKERTGREPSPYVQIMDVGLFQLEVRLAHPNVTRQMIPQMEIRCTNDLIKLWLCADSLVTLVNMASEISQSEAFAPIPIAEPIVEEDDVERSTVIDEGKSEAGESTWSRPASNRPLEMPLPVDKAQQLQQMMASAMEEEPSSSAAIPVAMEAMETLDDFCDTAPGSYSSRSSRRSRNRVDSTSENYHTRNTSLSTDDEFCMVDDVLGAGILGSHGEPRIRALRRGCTAEETGISPERSYFSQINDTKVDGLASLPSDYVQPICRYHIKDVSIQLHLFAGNDFGDQRDEPRPYSTDEYREGSGKGQTVPREERGGPHRDHSVSVILNLSKIQVLHQIFDQSAPMMGMTFATIQDITVKDRLRSSEINEMLYQYFTTENPRRTLAPMLAIRVAETHKCEGKLRVSLLPVRVNIDQYTLDFLEDFSTAVIKNLKLPHNVNLPMKKNPVIEVPTRILEREEQAGGRLYPSLSSEPLTPSPLMPHPYVDLSPLEERPSSSPVKRPLNIDPMHDSMAFCRDPSPRKGNEMSYSMNGLSTSLPEATGDYNNPDLFTVGAEDMQGDWASSSIRMSPPVRDSPEPLLPDLSPPPPSRGPLSPSVDQLLMRSTMEGSIHPHLDNMDSPLYSRDGYGEEHDEERDDATTTMEQSHVQPQKLTTFFKEFVFSPSATFYIDYQGKQINYEKDGAVLGVLKGLGKLNRTEIVLKEIICRNGLLGYDRCLQYAIDEWSDDIVSHFPNVLASCGPISPLVQIGRGFYDLFWMPVSEMRKEDGRLVKGIQKGAGSFGVSTAAAVVELAQTLVGAVQYATEAVFNEVNPAEPYQNLRNRKAIAGRSQAAPADLRQATQRAYDIVRDGVMQTKSDLDAATQENRANGQSTLRSWARFTAPAIMRPFVMTTQVTYQMLGGLRNQLRPDVYMEDRHKWKGAEPGSTSH
ncbi:unnamed protein product, partial [Mesorhabditis belari]|uniref:Autophagy-related protein 2 n=1 Tax=Mesorhabditis belari TaxID=2138241 RepID=A0AAF3EZ69_9BILA